MTEQEKFEKWYKDVDKVPNHDRTPLAYVIAISSWLNCAAEKDKEIAELEANLEKETVRADAWVNAARDLARELVTPDEDSYGSIPDWRRITAKARQGKALEAKLAIAIEALDKLSKLGNEPLVGNSIGNDIATVALNKIRSE